MPKILEKKILRNIKSISLRSKRGKITNIERMTVESQKFRGSKTDQILETENSKAGIL